uniref:Glycoside hydrolase 35 catalytic domain-containing protein n=1 Tax=Ditylenchus dipsaci TaxID=166011 RepID=A0A915EGD8_9BILA
MVFWGKTLNSIQRMAQVKNFLTVEKKINGGPYTNSEFYTVWFTGWGGKLLDLGWGAPGFTQNTSFSLNNVIENTVNSMADMYKMNASFSFYMIHGGTNFGFWSGDESTGPVITSYDYSAPISEAGQITPLYLAIRNFIKNLTNWPNPPLEVPQNHTAVAIDNVKTVRVGSLITVVQNSLNKDHCKQSETPLSFEVLDNQYDLVLYSSVLPKVVDGSHLMLTIPDLHDYAYVFVDDVYQGHLAIDQEYTHAFARLTLPLKNGTTGSKLDILVENHGRRTFETINDYKGILSNVTVNKQLITNWMQCGVNPSKLYSKAKEMWSQKTAVVEDGSPAVYVGTFESDVAWDDYHTFFDARKWNKGFVIVNNFNLGRYWTSMGPQMTLFAPGAIFRKKNVAVLIELVGQNTFKTETPVISFLEKPIYKTRSHKHRSKHTQLNHHFRHHHKHN